MNFFERIENHSAKVFYDRVSGRPIFFSEYILATLRILFSLLMLSRYLSSYQSSFLITNGLTNYYPIYFVLYLLLMLGLATPLVCLILIFAETITPLYIEVQINVLIPYLLIFLDTGSRISIDSTLGRFRPKLAKLNIAKAQLYLIWPYAVICLLAAIRHLHDPSWRSLNVGYSILSNQLTSGLGSPFIEAFKEYASLQWLLKLGVCVQLFWELAFIPLLFFKRGQIFVMSYGIFFFLLSCFFLRLPYLGGLELIYWGLVFHSDIGIIFHRLKND